MRSKNSVLILVCPTHQRIRYFKLQALQANLFTPATLDFDMIHSNQNIDKCKELTGSKLNKQKHKS